MGVSESKIREDAINCIHFGYGYKKFRKLVKKMKKMDINSIRDSSGSTLLNLSCQLGRKSIVFELLNLGANPNIPNNLGMTPLHHSMNNSDEESVSMLLKHGCNPNVVSETATTPLIIAVKKGDEKLVELLFGLNNNNNHSDTFGASASSFRSTSTPTIDGINITPIGSGGSSSNLNNNSSSSSNNNTIDVNLCDKQKMTALMWAATEGNDSLVKFLISVGADVNRRDNQGRTAMFIAKSGSHLNIVNMLNEQFCKVNKIILSKPSNNLLNSINNYNNNNNSSSSNNNNSNNNNNNNQQNVSHQSSVALPSQNFYTDSLASSWSSSDSNLNKNNNSSNNNNNNDIDKPQPSIQQIDNSNILITTNTLNSNNTPNISNKSQLKRDHSTLHSTISSSSKDERYCKVCWERPSDIVSLWCGHISLCMFCSQYLQTCPICVQTIERVQRVFVS